MVCVKECPDRAIANPKELSLYQNATGSKLCDYNKPVSEYANADDCPISFTGCYGPCPAFPVPVE